LTISAAQAAQGVASGNTCTGGTKAASSATSLVHVLRARHAGRRPMLAKMRRPEATDAAGGVGGAGSGGGLHALGVLEDLAAVPAPKRVVASEGRARPRRSGRLVGYARRFLRGMHGVSQVFSVVNCPF
jgi:hypothetical protein